MKCSRGTITSEETAKLFDESKYISCYEVYRRPSPVVERPSRVRLRNIFIGRNYTYVHACTHVLSFFVYRSLSLSSPPASLSRARQLPNTRTVGGTYFRSNASMYATHALPAFFSLSRFIFMYRRWKRYSRLIKSVRC